MKLFLKNYRFVIAFAAFIFLFQINVFAQNANEFIVVADKQTECRTNAGKRCLQIKKPQDTVWRTFDGQIQNFNYREGFFYLLRVRRIANRRSDISGQTFRLIEIISREKSENDPGNDSKLGDGRWILKKINGVNVNTNRAFIKFEEAKNRFGGNGGCNGFGGDLSVEGSRIDMSQIISTKMFCEATSDIENKFLIELERADRFEIRGKNLLLYRGRKLTLELIAEK